MSDSYDAVIVGAGPNGLAAAITLARAGCSVLLLEAAAEAGGGLRSAELTLPGFVHDSCATILPLAAASPFFRRLPLHEHGLRYVVPPAPLAHPLGGREAVVLERSLDDTVAGLGQDGVRYASLMRPLVANQDEILADFLGPLRLPRRPLTSLRFALPALLPAATLASRWFRGDRARALLAGLAAHAIMPLERPATAAFGMVLAMLGHNTGWPVVEGGSRSLARALVFYLESLGGRLQAGRLVGSVDELPAARVVLLDLTPRQVVRLAGHRLAPGYRRELERYRYGPGACKVDFALAGPIPWAAPECRRAGTVHVGGGLDEIAAGERAVWSGRHSERPFVIVAQPSLFDATRAPSGQHTAWAYCHVPHGSGVNVAALIEAQIERFAPGFGKLVLARHVRTAAALERYNPNLVGGDINGGVQDLRQLFTRPTLRLRPYATSDPRLFICSASTPPGGGVHGLCGHHAAVAALHRTSCRTL